jgi:uncharacterized small protein (DUF1192 family)
MDPEDLEPRKKQAKLRDLEALGVSELESYIQELKEELSRVEAKLAAKKAYLSGVSGLFKT